jgi:hypothetical protein
MLKNNRGHQFYQLQQIQTFSLITI